MNYISGHILKSKSKKRYFHDKRKIYNYLTMHFVFADVFIWFEYSRNFTVLENIGTI